MYTLWGDPNKPGSGQARGLDEPRSFPVECGRSKGSSPYERLAVSTVDRRSARQPSRKGDETFGLGKAGGTSWARQAAEIPKGTIEEFPLPPVGSS